MYTYFNKDCFGNDDLVFESHFLVVTQAKHCILLCVSMTKSLHISHILSALLQDIPSIALCMSGTLSSSSEVSICVQTESAETRHSQNGRKVCIMQKCNRHSCLTYPQSPSWALLCRGHPSQFFGKSANEKERWYSFERRPWYIRLKAHLLVLEFWSHFSKRDEFLYQKKTGKLGYRCHRVRPFVRVPLSIFSSKDSSLRTADTFPVVASLPLLVRRERSDDRKCVCCSQATRTLAQIYLCSLIVHSNNLLT